EPHDRVPAGRGPDRGRPTAPQGVPRHAASAPAEGAGSMSDTISILEGSTFVVSTRNGDIEASPVEPHGLFHFDTRYLPKWVLTVNGVRPKVLSTDDLDYFAAQFFLVPATGTIYIDSELSVIRRRWVGGGFHEDLVILNHSNAPIDLD